MLLDLSNLIFSEMGSEKNDLEARRMRDWRRGEMGWLVSWKKPDVRLAVWRAWRRVERVWGSGL